MRLFLQKPQKSPASGGSAPWPPSLMFFPAYSPSSAKSWLRASQHRGCCHVERKRPDTDIRLDPTIYEWGILNFYLLAYHPSMHVMFAVITISHLLDNWKIMLCQISQMQNKCAKFTISYINVFCHILSNLQICNHCCLQRRFQFIQPINDSIFKLSLMLRSFIGW